MDHALNPFRPSSRAPCGAEIPLHWSDDFVLTIARELRARLLSECAVIHTSDARRDWFLHMALQAHQLPTLLELVEEFNQAQTALPSEGFERLELKLHEAGFLLKRQTLTAS